MSPGASAGGCAICEFVETALPSMTVHKDDLWFAGVMSSIQIPGWIVLGTRRHTLDPMGMNQDEAASFGPILARLSTAIKKALGSERVYVVGYGENAQHWHVLLSSRGPEVPPEHRHAQFWNHREQYVNPPAAEAAAARIRDEMGAAAAQQTEEVS